MRYGITTATDAPVLITIPQKCIWTNYPDGDEADVWFTQCNEVITFADGTPQGHGYKFCHCCGKPIEFVQEELSDD